MPTYLKMEKRQQVIALLELGWSYLRIEAETGVRRETVSEYDRQRRSNPAISFPGSRRGRPAAVAGYRDAMRGKRDRGLSAQGIFQDLVEDFGYGHSHESIKRFVRTLRQP